MAALFHRAQYAMWARTPLELVESCAALYLLMRPSSVRRFLVLATLQIAHNWQLMPLIPNHALFVIFVDGTVVMALLVEIRARGEVPSGGALLERFAPYVRLELVILYFWVVFQKLNVDYFTLDSSCAIGGLAKLTGAPVESTFLKVSAIVGTLVVETAIPVMLLWRRWRVAGIALAMVFHFALGTIGFYDFSSMLIAVYFLFLDVRFVPDLQAMIAEGVGGLRSRIDRLRSGALWRSGLLAGPLAIVAVLLLGNDWSRSAPVSQWLWWPYGIACFALFVGVHRRRRAAAAAERPAPIIAAPLLRFSSPAMLLLPLLLFTNGLSPHLGLKTETSFAMFSNLRTEGGESNHYFLPASLQFFDYQRDLVRILDGSDPALLRVAGPTRLLTHYSLREFVSEAAAAGVTDLRVRYEHAGLVHSSRNAERDPELAEPPPYLLRKTFAFRRILTDADRGICTH